VLHSSVTFALFSTCFLQRDGTADISEVFIAAAAVREGEGRRGRPCKKTIPVMIWDTENTLLMFCTPSSKLIYSKLISGAHRVKLAGLTTRHTNTHNYSFLMSVCENMSDSSGNIAGARHSQPPRQFDIEARWQWRCVKLNAKQGHMLHCSMGVGPKFHLSKLSPTGNFKYVRVSVWLFIQTFSFTIHSNSIYNIERGYWWFACNVTAAEADHDVHYAL